MLLMLSKLLKSIILFLVIIQNVHSSENLYSISVEALGVGGWGSLNIERDILKYKNINLSVRLGLSTYKIKDFENKWNPDVIVPFGLHLNYGKRHIAEMGIGSTLSSIPKFDYKRKNKRRFYHLNYFASLAYKFQLNALTFIKLTYYPLVLQPGYFKHWAGLSVGYRF